MPSLYTKLLMDDTQPVQTTSNNPVGFPGANQPIQQTQPKKNWKWLIILILFLIVIGGVTFFVFKSSRSASSLNESPTPDTSNLTNIATPEPTSTPSASPTDKATINIQVLNGTGIAGEASYLVDQLKPLGYTNVTTGNATTQNATDTQVTFATTVPQDVVKELTAKLGTLYTNVTTNNSTLPSGIDVQITTGLKKGATSAPAATATNAPAASTTPSPTPTATP
jgi:heme/copper-type cytochrome/quinol oxidase subunit 2